MVLEKTLESPLDSKEIKPVNPKANQSTLKEISPEYALEELMLLNWGAGEDSSECLGQQGDQTSQP